MSDATLNEEIGRLEIEIDAVRDELDEAIKRNETLEAEIEQLRALADAQADAILLNFDRAEAAEAALATAREALEEIAATTYHLVMDQPKP